MCLKSLNSVFVLLFVASLASACGLNVGPKSERHDRQNVDLSHVTAVSFKGDSGDVTISPSADSSGSVEFAEKTSRYFAGTGHCHTSESVEGSTLYVEVTKDFNAGCEVETTIVAPS